ncbi:MAG: mechanosensitive ion channel [Candidatus Latescibacteria bacterium]|nr:mechanosensitive ion channel [bacterium]MCB9514354.1 mechanosensitive ion channel [Candidatus Latescibacterota bacterium]MCB9516624.1 mechanosensitive ion channel [Candidatus Latescibacterota bacterium]
MFDRWSRLLADWGLTGTAATAADLAGRAVALFVLCVVVNWVAKRVLLRVVTTVVRRTRTHWDDALLERQVFTRLSHLAPGLVLYLLGPGAFAPWAPVAGFVQKGAVVYMLAMALASLNALVNAGGDIYDGLAISRNKPIKGYLQIVKLLLALTFGIVMFSVLLGRSPLVLLSGLGAMTAVLLLVFKDSILGFVASIQISANDMLRPGDWIEMPRYGADGDVIDIALTTVKVRNWDKTITTIPSYSLISDSFRNWRGMEESGGRRIKRALNLDLASIRFLAPDEIAALKRIVLIRDYLEGKEKELADWNAERSTDPEAPVNSRRLTNVGTFRAYLAAYLRSLPLVHEDMTFLVRQLPPGEHGLPMEIYVFSRDQRWAAYEDLQSDIFDHVLAVVPEFGLRVYQSPSGADMRGLAAAASGRD